MIGLNQSGAAAAGSEPVERGSFQVVVLGAGGGPTEDNVTGILVRAVRARWAKNSILAVDAGVHLSSIVNIFQRHMDGAVRFDPSAEDDDDPLPSPTIFSPVRASLLSRAAPQPAAAFAPVPRTNSWGPTSPSAPHVAPGSKVVQTTGPFKNILLPCETAKANAQQLLRNLISTYLITHPHLDHFAGFAINTAAFHATSRPKKIAALPPTIDAIKTNIFNDVIWPNMSDEEGGIGFISYTRLIEGGNVALGEGEGRGYIEVCEGLEVKSRSVSHGFCMKRGSHRGSGGDALTRRPSRGDLSMSPDPRRGSMAHFDYEPRNSTTVPCVVDSTAFFIRAESTGDEILVFGDVEPDSISIAPRNARVWADAAPKLVSGLLKAVFIECSYPDSQTDETLFGHLAPRHLIAELAVLAELVESARQAAADPAHHFDPRLHAPPGSAGFDLAGRKRKRHAESIDAGRLGRGRASMAYPHHYHHGHGHGRASRSISPTAMPPPEPPEPMDDAAADGPDHPRQRRPTMPARLSSGRDGSMPSISVSNAPGDRKPLEGLRVVVIHIKDNLLDSPDASETVMRELHEHEELANLGVEFILPEPGGYMYL